jgi:hypothetical protein
LCGKADTAATFTGVLAAYVVWSGARMCGGNWNVLW